MKILKAVVICGMGADKVVLKTDLPPTTWPFNENASLSFDVAQGLAIGYLKENFPDIQTELVEIKRTTPKFKD